jgi:hypothetical protein
MSVGWSTFDPGDKQMTTIEARNVNLPQHRENLNAEKYTLIRNAMLASLLDDAWMPFSELEDKVRAWLDDADTPKALFPKPGSVRWYCKAVQLDLEARGVIERQPKKSPLHLRKCQPDAT